MPGKPPEKHYRGNYPAFFAIAGWLENTFKWIKTHPAVVYLLGGIVVALCLYELIYQGNSAPLEAAIVGALITYWTTKNKSTNDERE